MKAENNKTKRRLTFHWRIAAAATIVLAVLVGWASSWSTGPSYGGRYGEAWLRDVFAPNGAGTSQTSAIAAFNQMGTNGIAFLVESLDRRETAWIRFYRVAYGKLPQSLRRRVRQPIPADTLANAASLVLLNVRDDSPEKSVPRLVRLLGAPNPRTRLYAAGVIQHYALNYSKFSFAPFRPELVRALADTNDWIRIDIALALENAKLGGPELLPAVKPALTNSDPVIRNAAQVITRQLEAANKAAPPNHGP